MLLQKPHLPVEGDIVAEVLVEVVAQVKAGTVNQPLLRAYGSTPVIEMYKPRTAQP